jgi:hypothetical protein
MFSTSGSNKRSGARKAAPRKRNPITDAQEANAAYPLIRASSLPASTSNFWHSERKLGAGPSAATAQSLRSECLTVVSLTHLGNFAGCAYFGVICAAHNGNANVKLYKVARDGSTQDIRWLGAPFGEDFQPPRLPGEISLFMIDHHRDTSAPHILLMAHARYDKVVTHGPLALLYTLDGSLVMYEPPVGPPPADLEPGTLARYGASTPDGFIILDKELFSSAMRRRLISSTTFARLREVGPSIKAEAGKMLMMTGEGVVVGTKFPGDATFWSADARTVATVADKGRLITIYDAATDAKLAKIGRETEAEHVSVVLHDDSAMTMVIVDGDGISAAVYA